MTPLQQTFVHQLIHGPAQRMAIDGVVIGQLLL